MFNRLTPSVYTCNVNSACPWAWWFAREIKCTSFCRAVLQHSTNKTEHHRFVTNFHTYSPSKCGGANAPPAPPCAPALWECALLPIYFHNYHIVQSLSYRAQFVFWLWPTKLHVYSSIKIYLEMSPFVTRLSYFCVYVSTHAHNILKHKYAYILFWGKEKENENRILAN